MTTLPLPLPPGRPTPRAPHPPRRPLAPLALVRVIGLVGLLGVPGLSGAVACDAAQAPTPVAPADVTFLLPLTRDPGALTAGSLGAYGVLVPRAHLDAMEPLTRVDEPDDLYAALTVVAVRLDPCFIEGGGESPCASQIRLVLQPVVPDPAATDALTTRDAAIHAFYAVPRADLDRLARELARLRIAQRGPETVGLHADWKKALALVAGHIGEARLNRITQMSVHTSGEAWVFSGVDIVAGQRIAIAIPGVGEHGAPNPPNPNDPHGGRFRFEQHLTSSGAREDLAATLIPEPVIEGDIAGYLDDARRGSLTDTQRVAALEAIERLLDPADHDPGTVDCASCHVATTALRFATREEAPGRVPAAYDDTRNQRMLGWFGATPSISPRVLLETDAVVSRLTALD